MAWGAYWGLLQLFQVSCNAKALGPQNASHPHPSAPPQPPSSGGRQHWRRTGKPTKIFQIREICGADKSWAGWDEASVAPKWGGPVKSGLRLPENASSPALGWAVGGSLSWLPPEGARAEGSHGERARGPVTGLRVTHGPCSLPPGRLVVGGAFQKRMASLGCWWGLAAAPGLGVG